MKFVRNVERRWNISMESIHSNANVVIGVGILKGGETMTGKNNPPIEKRCRICPHRFENGISFRYLLARARVRIISLEKELKDAKKK